jgi:hypothetical protein
MCLRSSIRIRILRSSLSFAQRQVIRLSLPTTLITVFLLLRPEDVLENDSTYHHAEDEEPADDEETGEYAAEDANGTAVIQSACYCESGSL